MYLIKTTLIYHTAEKRIWMRNSCIPLTFLLYDIVLYSGNCWVTRKVTFWNIGFKFGEFTFTRKYTFFKKKKKKKINEIWTGITDLLN